MAVCNSVPKRNRVYQPYLSANQWTLKLNLTVANLEIQCAHEEPLIPNQDSTGLLPQFPQLAGPRTLPLHEAPGVC